MNTRSALYHYLATSTDPIAASVRKLKRDVETFEVRFPRPVEQAMRLSYEASRKSSDWARRVFIAQPLFRAYCASCGDNLRTGEFIHFIQGSGDIIVGDNVWLDGRINFTFAATFDTRPTLIIGDNTSIGHQTEFSIGKRVTLGKNCLLSGNVSIFDSNGHPSDPDERRAGKPPAASDVRPVTLGDDVWMGKHSTIFPGVRVGDGAIISAHTVVRRHVPPYSVVAGNPAQLMFRLPRPARNNDERQEIAERAERAVRAV